MPTMTDIEAAAEALARDRRALSEAAQTLEIELSEVKTRHAGALRLVAAKAATSWKALLDAVRAAPELFSKPRSVVLHGIKLGWQKGKGSIDIANPDRTVGLIKKHFPDQVATLIATREVPVKDALAQLPAADLKRLGVAIGDTDDQPFIRAADGDVDKLVRNLIDQQLEDA